MMSINMTIDYSTYDIIEFKDTSSNCPKKCRGIKIGTSLIVSGTEKRWKIFLINSGKPIINVLFINCEDAVQIAEWIEDVYHDFLQLFDEYPNIDMFGMVKWTVKDGIRNYEAMKLIKTKRLISMQDFKESLREAGKHVRFWTRKPRRNS